MTTSDPYSTPSSDITSDIQPGKFDIGQCFSDGWKMCWANFPGWLGVGIVGLLISVVATFTVIGIFVVLPVIMWGSIVYSLKMYEGTAEFNDLFAGFKTYGKSLGRFLLYMLIMFGISIATQSIELIGTAVGSTELTLAGSIISLICSLILIKLYFTYFLMVEQDMGAVDSISKSWNMTRGSFWNLVLLLIVTYLIMLAGLLVLVVGIFPAMAISTLMWVSAYKQMTATK